MGGTICSNIIWSKRRKGIIRIIFLISNVSVKLFLLQKQIYLRLQRFYFTSVLLLARKRKSTMENKAVSSFPDCLIHMGKCRKCHRDESHVGCCLYLITWGGDRKPCWWPALWCSTWMALSDQLILFTVCSHTSDQLTETEQYW